MQTFPLAQTPEQDLKQRRPDVPVLYLSPKALQGRAHAFQAGFPGLVTYAVKANPHPNVIDNLVAAGLHAFDVASPAEMALVRAADPDAALHYNNPIRSVDEVAEGVRMGVVSWSVDDMNELEKLRDVPRTEVSVRFKLPVPGAAYDFGEKFGATKDAAVSLLRRVADMGFAPALCFHPGTQCTDPSAWTRYIETAAEISRKAGVRIARLNVGGGFPSDRGAGVPPLSAFFEAIKQALHAFHTPPDLLCEPGRAMVADAATLAIRIKARRGDILYVNDGTYGGLSELRDVGPMARVRLNALEGSRATKMQAFRVYGPTCDSLDRLPDGLHLPVDAAPGDYILIDGMGAYSTSISTLFNGYGAIDVRTVDALSGHRG